MKTDRCVKKLGEPGQMRECGREVVYRTVADGATYEGWYHVEAVTDHHAVPSHWTR
jgi:hypothetical protein